jgi:hypothetical protein
MAINSYVATGVRWIARLAAAAMFLLAGAFFLEHMSEWFIKPFPQMPPLYVWVGQLLHLVYLAGLIIGLRWERLGGCLAIAAAALFLWDKNPTLILPSIVPGVLYLMSWYLDRKPKCPVGPVKG